MKRMIAALAAALMLAMTMTGAWAQTRLTVYIAPEAAGDAQARELMRLMERAMPEASFERIGGPGETLGGLVMEDRAPNLALCPAQQAAPWAQEGMLLAHEDEAVRAQRAAKQILSGCTLRGETLVMPLAARFRRVAVNRDRLHKLNLDNLLDPRRAPVWLPMQLFQVMEESVLAGGCAMEVWPAGPEDGTAVITFIQALYSGLLLDEEGACCADSGAVISAVEWLQEMADAGLIGRAQSRQAALERFLAGETALFIDWTDEDAAHLAAQGAEGLQVYEMPYPSSMGVPLRDTQVVGAVAFASDDEAADALALQAAAFLAQDDQAQIALGRPPLEEDGAMWLPVPGIRAQHAVLRGAMGAAVDSVMNGEIGTEAAMRIVQAAAEAAGGR